MQSLFRFKTILKIEFYSNFPKLYKTALRLLTNETRIFMG